MAKNLFNCPIWGLAAREYLRPKYNFLVPFKGETRSPIPFSIFGGSIYKEVVKRAINTLDVKYRKAMLPFILGNSKNEKSLEMGDMIDIRNLLVTGSQGGGKSRFLISTAISLKYFTTPGLLKIHVLDFKGNLSVLSPICHFEKDPKKILKKLEQLSALRKQVQGLVDKYSQNDLLSLNRYYISKSKKILKYNIIIIDEYTSLVQEENKISGLVENLSAMGRSAGFFIIISTQRADHVTLSSRIKSNFLSSISFAQRDFINAQVAGVKGSEKLTKPGELIYNHKLDLKRLQTPYFSLEQARFFTKNLANWLTP